MPKPTIEGVASEIDALDEEITATEEAIELARDRLERARTDRKAAVEELAKLVHLDDANPVAYINVGNAVIIVRRKLKKSPIRHRGPEYQYYITVETGKLIRP